jgi:hypothetical protein
VAVSHQQNFTLRSMPSTPLPPLAASLLLLLLLSLLPQRAQIVTACTLRFLLLARIHPKHHHAARSSAAISGTPSVTAASLDLPATARKACLCCCLRFAASWRRVVGYMSVYALRPPL